MPDLTIIVPCAGRSSRYPDTRPKWMLTHPVTNMPMAVSSLQHVGMSGKELVITTILEEHDERYDAAEGLRRAFDNAYAKLCLMPDWVDICVLSEQTTSQADTVVQTIADMSVTGPIFIKDSDNQFCVDLRDFDSTCNHVCTSDLTDHEEINPRNKSYCVTNSEDMVLAVHEKQIVSSTFSAGGYFFRDAQVFANAAQELIEGFPGEEVYVSHVINTLIAKGEVFHQKRVKDLKDWGTLHDWQRFLSRFKTYFIDIDGLLVKNAGRYFEPRREGMGYPITPNIEAINKLFEAGNRIVLTTARPKDEHSMTVSQLLTAGLKWHDIVMGCLHSGRVLINDFAPSNPYPSATALSVPRDTDRLADYLKE